MTRFLAIFPLFLLFALGACTAPKNSLKYETYVATDFVLHQANYIDSSTPILVGTITDIDMLETSSTLGRMISEQITARLTQQGYNVTELKMRTSLNIKDGRKNASESGEYMLSRDVDSIRAEQKAAIAITGTYAVAGQDVLVNLKLLDVATGKILGATDYTIRKDSNVARLISNNRAVHSGESFYGTSMAY